MGLVIAESAHGDIAHNCRLLGWGFSAFTFAPKFPSLSVQIDEGNVGSVGIGFSSKTTLYLDLPKDEDAARRLGRNFGWDIAKYYAWYSKNMDDDGRIYLAHDLDAMGQLMASLLRFELIKNGVAPDRIFRLVLAEYDEEEGRMKLGFGEFYGRKRLSAVLELVRTNLEIMRVGEGRTNVGLRKGFALMAIERMKSRGANAFVPNKNPTGTSLSTYLTNYLALEEESENDNKELK